MRFFAAAIALAYLLSGTVQAANLTTTSVQAAGADWNAAIWKTNGTGTSVSPIAGNTYATIFNGTSIGNGAANTRIRNPASATVQTFVGDSLTLNTNTELRAKGIGATLNFPGVGGNPGLILNGGMLNGGDDSTFPVTGRIQISGQSYISHGANGGGGGISPNRAFNISGVLSGSGTMVIMNAGTLVPQVISGTANTFSGQWIVQCGWLRGDALDSLGTNSVTVDPAYNGYLATMPGATSPFGPAWFEPNYDLNSAGALTLINGGVMVLHQNCTFSSVSIEGVPLSTGTHYYSELAANFPGNFAANGSGSITVQTYGPPPPVAPTITTQPQSLARFAGSPTQLVAGASGSLPLSWQWQKGTNGNFINASDGGDVLGTHTNVLTFSALQGADAADYRVIVSNTLGAATSQVATVTVLFTDTNRPTVAVLSPPANSTVNSLTQIQVTFSENVFSVSAGDLLINGIPADSVTGSGSNYVFSFTQPIAGTVLAYWDSDTEISDGNGNYLDPSGSWTYTLVDNLAPTLAKALPASGSTVGLLTQAQVMFSEAVGGVSAADLLMNGVAATNLSGSGAGPYLFNFSPPTGSGTVNFTWRSAHNIRDLSANSNRFNGSGWSVTLDPEAAAAALTNLVINEFLAANVSAVGLVDEDGQLSDWIELYNRGPAAINLGGWSLTDDPDQPTLWSFPAMNIPAGSYLVVYASGKDRALVGGNLHTSFALPSAGSYLALNNPEFPVRTAHEFAPEYPEQRNDISFGLDAANQLAYFSLPTPGYANASSSLTGVVSTVHFSVEHGFFNQPFNLLLTTTTPGATIVYTTNGSVPDMSNGITNGNVYGGPIPISGTTVIRAAGFAPNLLPTLTKSQTYLFVEDIVHQPNNPSGYPTGNVWTPNPGVVETGSRAYYQMDPNIVNDPQYSGSVRDGLTSIPTMSISIPIPDLFDPDTGIYTHPESRSTGWERSCSMELIFPDGSKGAQVDCGLQIQGGTQRQPGKNAKHSFRVNFKGVYGTGKLDFPLFPDSPVEKFNTLVLDGGINYWWNYVGGNNPADQRYRAQCVRDQFASDLLLAMGHPSFHGKFYHLYLNGLYWGIHYIHERPDEDYAASYLGGSSTNYDVIKNTTFGTQLIAGDLDAWNTVLSLSNSGLTNNSQYAQLQQYVDIDNLIDYMIVNHWTGNDDWPQHNWYVIRNRSDGSGFKFIIWDAEHVLKSVTENVTTANAAGSPAQIYNALRSNPEFKLQFADRLQKHFSPGGLFYTDPNHANAIWDPAHPERNVPASLYMKRITEITNAIVDESARWGGYLLTTNYTRNLHWLRELNNLLGYATNSGNTADYFPSRSATVLNQYRSIGLFPGTSAPVFNRAGGNVASGFSLFMTNLNASGTIYYTTNGTDPRAFGSGAVAQGALVYSPGATIPIRESQSIVARVLNGGTWSAQSRAEFTVASLGIPIRITELMYNPVGGDAYEYIELQNIGTVSVDLSRFSFDGIKYVFPDGSILPAGGVLVLSSDVNPAAFASRYPGVSVFGAFGGSLSNTGERIALLDTLQNTVTSVDYKNSGGWPIQANGAGRSLESIAVDGDPDDPANWRASLAADGSPGRINAPGPVYSVRFNEVMADNVSAITNGGTLPDWIELYNSAPTATNIANWSFSNSGNTRKYVFPGGTTIGPHGYLVIWCDTQTNAPGLHSGFNLGRKGENLFLYDAATNRIDAFSFGLQLSDYTVGRVGSSTSWALTLPTPGSTNVAAAIGAATNLVINEWLANSATGASDWLELYNQSSNLPIALNGLYLSTSNQLFQLRSVSFLPPRGFIQLFADENPGPDHLDFKLPAEGANINLYDPTGQLIDNVSYQNQQEGISEGRFPNGSGTIVEFPGSATPGLSNYVVSYSGPILNEFMARNSAAVYDFRGNNSDWVEIYNPGASPFDLSGMGLSTAPNAVSWVFPPGTTIAANGYLLVWCDSAHAASTNAGANLNAGFSLSGGGDSIYLFNTSGQVVDTVSFGQQLTDTALGRLGTNWALMTSPTPAAANSGSVPLGQPMNLRINEWMAAPASGNDWFELYNADASPVDLSGLYLTDDPSVAGLTKFRIPPLSFIAGHGWAQFDGGGSGNGDPDRVNFSLDRNGETIRLYNTDQSLIDSIDYGLQVSGTSQGRLPDGGSSIVTFSNSASPNASNFLPLPNVVINEVLAHTDPPLEDAIELYNTSANPVSIGGWFLSNSEIDQKRYQIPDGTSIPGHGYKVFYEYQFNSTNGTPFTLNSAHGDKVFLSEADSGSNLTGYRAQVAFGASENGVSFGRVATSVGADFVALQSRTFGVDNPISLNQFRTGAGASNALPRIGPLTINEILYHPVDVSGTNFVENENEEFVELVNTSSNTVNLFDPAAPTNHWKIDGGISFTFPANASVNAGQSILLVPFDPLSNNAALINFRQRYGVATNAALYGPFSGHLGNSGDSIEIYKPDAPQLAPHPDTGFVPYILVERITYTDTSPWANADGNGSSLQKTAQTIYGNEPLNWIACAPTAGLSNCGMDSDGDGLPDDWEIAHGFDPHSASGINGANGDPDNDGFTNLQEFLAGTDPNDPQSGLKFISATRSGSTCTLVFNGVAGHSYTLEYKTALQSGSWLTLTNLPVSTASGGKQVTDTTATNAARFYRLLTQ